MAQQHRVLRPWSYPNRYLRPMTLKVRRDLDLDPCETSCRVLRLLPRRASLTFMSMCLLLAAVTLLIFLPVAQHDFVNLDDPDYITDNLHIRDGMTWSAVCWAFRTGSCGNWHPLTWLSHMLDFWLFGLEAGCHHLVNVGFHVTNALLLFGVLKRITGVLWRSAAVAAAFAWHPMHVESVAWASERKDVLSAFFFLLTIWAYVNYVGVRGHKAQCTVASPTLFWRGCLPAAAYYILSIALFALGLMSKPMLVTLPFVMLLIDIWPLRRFYGSLPCRTILFLLLEKAPFLVLSLGSSCATFFVQRDAGAVAEVCH